MTGIDSGHGSTGLRRGSRGRVPFAIVAVLLLVSAVAVVGYLEARGPGETDTDPALAMDRTESAVQTALRDATASAAQQAAAEPLTLPSNTSYGNRLDGDRPFVSYLEALVYIEAQERFADTGQRVGDIRTTVSLPPISDNGSFEQALDRVELSETEPGLLELELGGIELVATRGGERVASRNETVTLSVPSPVLQQHDRTQAFQERLDAGVTSGGSFSQRFNARTYVLGWVRGYAQYGGLPVTEVIANRHVIPSANSALYRTQQDVFGAADPNLDTAVRRGWLCMAAKDAEGLYNGYSNGGSDIASDICEASEWVLGQKHSGALPEAPDTVELLGEATGMNQEQTIGVNETAYSPLRTLIAGSGEHSIAGAIERVFTIETDIDAELTTTGPEFDHTPPHPDATLIDTERVHSGVSVDSGTVVPGNPEVDGTYHEFTDLGAGIEVTDEQTWEWTENGSTEIQKTVATGTIDVRGTVRLVESETAPDLHSDAYNGNLSVEYSYRRGPGSTDEPRTVPTGFRNYADSERRIAEAVLGGTSLAALEGWLADRWDNVTGGSQIDLSGTQEVTLELDTDEEAKLVSTAIEDISQLQQTVERINHTFQRTELIRGENETGPVGELAAAVSRQQAEYLDREQQYESVGQQVVYEVREAYFEQLVEDLDRLDGAHGAVMGELDSHLDGIDSSLDDVLSFLQQGVEGVTGGEDSSPSLDSPELTPEITYEVSGSPTYLAGEVITSEEVPAVEQGGNFSPLAAKNRNYLKLPYDTVVNGILNSVLDTLNLGGDSDAELTLRTAGEALRAGTLAEDAAAADESYASDGELGSLTDSLEIAVDSGLDEFADEMGVEIVREVYDVEPDAPLFWPPYLDETHATVVETVAEAATNVTDAHSTAEAAIAVGGGNATDSLATGISTALDDGEIERPPYAESLNDNEWRAVVASAVRPALDRAAANATVTLESTSLVEDLDNETREALADVSSDIVRDRLDAYVDNGTFDLSEYESWVGNGSDIDTPVRVPAGLPILPVPTMWAATMNLWDIDADGQYTRFEVAANMSAPGRATSTTYVRENTTVETEIAGESRRLGRVEPIDFDGRSLLVVVVPPGGIGVGDRDDEDPECTETYPVVGRFEQTEQHCSPVP
ncbi:MAG: hypothetical protein J07HX64_02376 [halophilic archaeon J07HX64]|jgi:hypothetical protein|nr:MAG: hypothetical protein J07HX64_02376 [halophilic archaeon J07HX64]